MLQEQKTEFSSVQSIQAQRRFKLLPRNRSSSVANQDSSEYFHPQLVAGNDEPIETRIAKSIVKPVRRFQPESGNTLRRQVSFAPSIPENEVQHYEPEESKSPWYKAFNRRREFLRQTAPAENSVLGFNFVFDRQDMRYSKQKRLQRKAERRAMKVKSKSSRPDQGDILSDDDSSGDEPIPSKWFSWMDKLAGVMGFNPIIMTSSTMAVGDTEKRVDRPPISNHDYFSQKRKEFVHSRYQNRNRFTPNNSCPVMRNIGSAWVENTNNNETMGLDSTFKSNYLRQERPLTNNFLSNPDDKIYTPKTPFTAQFAPMLRKK